MEHAKAILDYKKKHGDNGSSSEEVSNHKNVLQVVDTTLLKCYIKVIFICALLVDFLRLHTVVRYTECGGLGHLFGKYGFPFNHFMLSSMLLVYSKFCSYVVLFRSGILPKLKSCAIISSG